MALQNKVAVRTEQDEKAKPVLSAGTASELDTRGFAASPFSGALLVGNSSNFREVDEKEYLATVKAYRAKHTEKKESNLL